MNYSCLTELTDHGPNPYVANMEQLEQRNTNFRTAIRTGEHLQMTLMCIPSFGEIGLENHKDTDQVIRIEEGNAIVRMGKCKNHLDFQRSVCKGDIVFVPAGIWHNITNVERNPLKISSIYAPPHHPRGTVHRTKADEEREHFYM